MGEVFVNATKKDKLKIKGFRLMPNTIKNMEAFEEE